MNLVEQTGTPRRKWRRPSRGIPLCALVLALLGVTGWPFAQAAEPAASTEKAPSAAADESAKEEDNIISLAAYNVKADRIEDFGLRVDSVPYDESKRPNLVTLWFTKFAPLVASVVPNTAAARAGLQPGDRILKSDGRPTVGGPFSTGKFGEWTKAQKRKWADVAAGKTNVTWTLEVESAGTKAVRTVKLVIPTPPPHWGSSVWRAPEGRKPSTVSETGPLADVSRTILDNGIWTWIGPYERKSMGFDLPVDAPATGYHWRIGEGRAGRHVIFVTQVRGRTEVIFAASGRNGARAYLTSPSGVLVKAGRWQRGKLMDVPPEEARLGFEHEVELWTKKVGKVSPRWPLELQPGYDPDAIFAQLAPKGAKPAAVETRPRAEEFLKLPVATEAQRELFTDAYGKLGADSDRWAYTETSRGIEDKRVVVTRVDPAKPEAEGVVLLSIDGRAPTVAEVARWRDDGGDVPKALGDIPPLASVVDLKELRVAQEEAAATIFELPIQGGNAEFPAEKFQALFRVNKTTRAFEEITVKLRDSFRVAGVVKVVDAGLELRFQTLDPALAPQPVFLKAGGGVRVLLVKISRSFEATRTDFKRVVPLDEPAAPGK